METFSLSSTLSQLVTIEFLAERRGMTVDDYIAFLLSKEVWDTSPNPAPNA